MSIEKYYEPFLSKNLYYQKLTTNDTESWCDFFRNNPNLIFLGMDLSRSVDQMAEEWISTQIRRYESRKFGLLGVYLRDTNILVGTVGFKIVENNGKSEIVKATLIKPNYWRAGIGREASLAIIGKAFLFDLVDKIIGYRHVDNRLSELFNRDLGFKDIGIFQEKSRKVIKYEITKELWTEKHGIYTG